jgi:PAS domain S-box-containing protein
MAGDGSLSTDQEHARLVNALRESEILREIASLLTSSLDLTHILSTLAKRTTEVCEIERCAVWLLDTAQHLLKPATYHLSTNRLSSENIARGDTLWRKSTIPLDDPFIQRIFNSSEGMIFCENLSSEPTMRTLAKQFLIKSILMVALKRDERPVGLLSLDIPGKRTTFTSTQRQLVHAIAQQATIAIDNAQLYQQAQEEHRRVEQLIGRAQSIYQIAKAVNSGTPLSTVLHIALEHLVYHLGASGGSIALIENNQLSIVAKTYHDDEFNSWVATLSMPQLHELPHALRAATEKRSIFVTDKETRGKERQWYQHLKLSNAMIIPLLLGTDSASEEDRKAYTSNGNSQCIGLIYVTYEQPAYLPSPGHFAFAEDIATQCALAIEKEHILTEAHQAATLATERANMLNAVLEAMTEGITVFDMQGHVLISNKTASQFIGMPIHAGTHLLDFLQRFPTYTLHGQPIKEEDFPLSRALRNEPIHGDRFITHRADGSERVVEVNVAPLLNSEQQKIGIVGAFRDITEQFRIERRLRRALDTILHAVEAVSGVTDTRTILYNVLEMALHTLSAYHGVLHLYHEQSQGLQPQLAMHFANQSQTHWIDKHPDETDQLRYAQLHLKMQVGHAIVLRADECPYHCNVAPSTQLLAVPLIRKNRLLGVITLDRQSDTHATNEDTQRIRHHDFTGWDITLAEGIAQIAALALDEAHWQQEATTARLNEAEMRASNEFKDEFIEITAHEFRNPISVILAYSQYIERYLKRNIDPSLRSTLQEFTTNIENQAHQLEQIVNTLVEVTRLNKRQITLDLTELDLSDLVQQVVTSHGTTMTAGRILYTVEDAPTPYRVRGDATRLTQIISNLLQNAIKYNLPDRDIMVTLRQVPDVNGSMVIEGRVIDHGIGIPKEAQPHLFERFYRAPNVEGGKTRGVGLGLYIVAELLRLHGGTIRVESSGIYGKGSTFIFTLPLLS